MTEEIKDRYTRRVDRVRVGDRMDLRGDAFADPDNDPRSELPYMFAEVLEIEKEGRGCIVLHTSLGSFGFPPDHYVEVDPEQARGTGEGGLQVKYAAHTDRLVLGVGDTPEAALADAELNGAENESLLDICEISEPAAEYVQRGGDCRALTWITLKNGDDRIIIDTDEEIE